MAEWFSEIADVEDPGRSELILFLDQVQNFLGFVLEDNTEFGFLWEDNPELLDLARETFALDIGEGIGELKGTIPKIREQVLFSHGLRGRPLRFKLKLLSSISEKWRKVKGKFTVREWLKRIFDAIDAILDSLINAAGGVGGMVKEFKDALSALVKTVDKSDLNRT